MATLIIGDENPGVGAFPRFPLETYALGSIREGRIAEDNAWVPFALFA
jgi:hypothetical protein